MISYMTRKMMLKNKNKKNKNKKKKKKKKQQQQHKKNIPCFKHTLLLDSDQHFSCSKH